MAADNSAPKPHIVLVPLPFQGHITPAVNLAIKLASKGFVITFVNAEAKHQTISKLTNSSSGLKSDDIFVEARSAGLDIRYELIAEGVPELLDISLYPKEIWDLVTVNIPAHVEKLLQRLVSENCGDCISCIITDTFYRWPATLAKKFRIPFVSFWTEPATVLSLYYHVDLLIKNGHYDVEVKDRAAITYIPGISSIEPTDLILFLQEPTATTPSYDWFFKIFESAKEADFVLGNTVQELELQCIEALQQEQTFFAIGPITREEALTSSIINTSLWPESDCSKWLDMQPQASVLYISFGSLFQPNKRDFQEILHGILGSKARFLGVCPPKSDNFCEFDKLSKENEDRGMTVSWCNQKEVLKHPAIGGFLTHCGWNSILESIWCEVPMLCFPLSSDQFTNKKLVVKDWNIGLDIGPINDVSRDKVSEMIDSLICGSEIGIATRNKVREVKKALENALSPTGSSQKNFDLFVEELLKLYESKMCNQVQSHS